MTLRSRSVFVTLMLAALLLPVGLAAAGPGSASFTVKATLLGTGQESSSSGYCKLGPSGTTAGAVLLVVCGTGQVVSMEAPFHINPWIPIHGGAYRYLLSGSAAQSGLDGSPLMLSDFDIYTVTGTYTTWRVVRLNDFKYVEMQVGW